MVDTSLMGKGKKKENFRGKKSLLKRIREEILSQNKRNDPEKYV